MKPTLIAHKILKDELDRIINEGKKEHIEGGDELSNLDKNLDDSSQEEDNINNSEATEPEGEGEYVQTKEDNIVNSSIKTDRKESINVNLNYTDNNIINANNNIININIISDDLKEKVEDTNN